MKNQNNKKLFQIEHKDDKTNARTGYLTLYHGQVKTPVFMPVGTNGTVKTFLPYELLDMDIQIILSNAYHLYLRPGIEVIEKANGLHNFTKWNKNILTDSGGFQLYSLSSLNRVKENGIYFSSHIDGGKHFLSPIDVINIQKTIGSDIMMVLDHCTSFDTNYKKSIKALEITTKWAKESINYFNNNIDSDKQKLFGIIQGNFYLDLRKECALQIVNLDFDGYAIGGLSVGESEDKFCEVLNFTSPFIPFEKPRYLMGVGTPDDILTGVENGIDMFDCVFPTRIARNAAALTNYGRINLRNKKYELDQSPLDDKCDCYMCKNFSRSYIKHLFKAKEISACRMTSYHNIYFIHKFMNNIRNAINNNKFLEFKHQFLEKFSSIKE